MLLFSATVIEKKHIKILSLTNQLEVEQQWQQRARGSTLKKANAENDSMIIIHLFVQMIQNTDSYCRGFLQKKTSTKRDIENERATDICFNEISLAAGIPGKKICRLTLATRIQSFTVQLFMRVRKCNENFFQERIRREDAYFFPFFFHPCR